MLWLNPTAISSMPRVYASRYRKDNVPVVTENLCGKPSSSNDAWRSSSFARTRAASISPEAFANFSRINSSSAEPVCGRAYVNLHVISRLVVTVIVNHSSSFPAYPMSATTSPHRGDSLVTTSYLPSSRCLYIVGTVFLPVSYESCVGKGKKECVRVVFGGSCVRACAATAHLPIDIEIRTAKPRERVPPLKRRLKRRLCYLRARQQGIRRQGPSWHLRLAVC